MSNLSGLVSGARITLSMFLAPTPEETEAVLNLLARDRLRPGGLTVESLKLDPKAHPGLGVDFRFLPVRPARASGFSKL